MLPDCDDHVEQPDDEQRGDQMSPRVYVVVGRKESVFNFMALKRRYWVAAEDVEELCWSDTGIIERTRARSEIERKTLLIEVQLTLMAKVLHTFDFRPSLGKRSLLFF